jgi:uncharacterized RDD family membrane protein YckC
MSALRLILSVLAIVGLSAGYALSQYSYLQGPIAAREYARLADGPAVSIAALLVALAAAILCFVPDNSRNESAP